MRERVRQLAVQVDKLVKILRVVRNAVCFIE